VVSADADLAALETIFRSHGRAFSTHPDDWLVGPLAPGERCFWTTQAHCDCGTPLGEAHRNASRVRDPTIAASRLRRKGWSDARIARAHAQREEASRRERRHADGQTTLAEWCELIRDALGSRAVSALGLVLHWRGNEDTIVLESREVSRSGQVNEAVLAAIRENVLYEFRS
jgi:hypothetical protein